MQLTWLFALKSVGQSETWRKQVNTVILYISISHVSFSLPLLKTFLPARLFKPVMAALTIELELEVEVEDDGNISHLFICLFIFVSIYLFYYNQFNIY